MTLEQDVLIGKNQQTVGLSFGFGCLLNMEQKFGYSSQKLATISQKLAILAQYAAAVNENPTANIAAPEISLESSEINEFMAAVVKSANYSYAELNDEATVLTNDTKAYVALESFGFEKISEAFFAGYYGMLQATMKDKPVVESAQKKTKRK